MFHRYYLNEKNECVLLDVTEMFSLQGILEGLAWSPESQATCNHYGISVLTPSGDNYYFVSEGKRDQLIKNWAPSII